MGVAFSESGRMNFISRGLIRAGLVGHPSSDPVMALAEDLYRFGMQFKAYSAGHAYESGSSLSPSDFVLGQRMIQIANSFGFRFYGTISGGSFHFMDSHQDPSITVYIYLLDWPRGAVMGLHDTVAAAARELGLKKDYRIDHGFVPRDKVVNYLIELIQVVQNLRHDRQQKQSKTHSVDGRVQ